MADEPNSNARERIDNTLAILRAQDPTDIIAMRRNVALAIETLLATREAIDERDQQLELITAPELDAATEVQRLRAELETTQSRLVELEQGLAMAQAEKEIEERIHDEDTRRLKQLEKRQKDFNATIMKDDDAFEQFMDQALDRQDDELRRRKS